MNNSTANISNALKHTKIKYCKLCGKEYNKPGKTLFCCKEHRNIYQYKLQTLIKYFGFDKSVLGTIKAIDEYNKIKQMLYNFYWVEHKSSSEIAKMFNYKRVENLTSKVFPMLGISRKTLSQAIHENYLSCKYNSPHNNKYKFCWHTTWDNKNVFLRSSYELDYAKQLDKYKIHYDVEKLRIEYFDTQQKRYRIAIPDFYISSTNTIVEVKSNYTLDLQNMKDKHKAYKENGYNFKLILELNEKDINKL